MESVNQPDTQDEREREKQERIIARRRMVEAKLEAKRKEEAGEIPQEVVEEVVDEEKERKSFQQREKSHLRLDKLTTDGSELVSNVLVAEDAREVQCRQEQEEDRNARNEKFEAESTAGEERFEEIMKKWDTTNSSKVPQDLQRLIEQQKATCDAMTDEKDKLVNEFQQELKAQDDQYVKYLKKQAEEVDLIIERMEEQAHTLLRAHRQEMTQIENSFTAEREALRDKHKSEWEEAVAERQRKEASFLARQEERIDENEAQLQHLRRRNMEDFNRIKIKLETDIQTLQQQIQQMKATFLLNAEKLEYNFQVLKKRDEENTATISQQKRRITRLQDTHNQLSTKLRKQSKTQQSELQALMEEYRKNTEQYRDIQKKAKHFQMADAKLFQDVWAMNEGKVRDLARDVAHADSAVHTQQLGLEWVKPQEIPSPMELTLATVKSRMSQATIYASHILSQSKIADENIEPREGKVQEEEGERSDGGEGEVSRAPAATVYPPSIVKKVLELLCEEAGFLLDEKLTRLVAPLPKEEQMMMKLDSMFKSLGVHTEEDIQNLVQYFINDGGNEVEGIEGESEVKEGDRANAETGANLKEDLSSESIEKYNKISKMVLIHPNDIPSAIRRYIEQRKSTTKPPPSHGSSALGLSSTAQKELLDGSFWQQMIGVLPQSHEQVWDALLEGLEKYHGVVMKRSKCTEETQALVTQNNELRMLLQTYMHSRINEELEIPPTFMLPV